MGEVLSGCKLRGPVATFALRWESQLTPVGTKRIPLEILIYHCGMVLVAFDKGLKKKPEENEREKIKKEKSEKF